MNQDFPTPPSFWKTVRLLLANARKRSKGRGKRQQELLSYRTKKSTDWGHLGFVLTVLFMTGLSIAAAFLIRMAARSGQRSQAEQAGKIVVSRSFLNAATHEENGEVGWLGPREYENQAKDIAEEYGGAPQEIEQKIRSSFNAHGTRDFVSEDSLFSGLDAFRPENRYGAMWSSFVLMLWLLMLVFQGEGLELDIQRRRHPTWEWLFSHPVRPGAVFLAEMLSPIAANPVYWGAPLGIGFLYGYVYDAPLALLAVFVVGVPVTIAAACLGKAIEIAVTLRFAARTRGAIIGLMSWFGYASLMFIGIGLLVIPELINITSGRLAALTTVPWPWLGMLLGARNDGSFSFLFGVVVSGFFAAIITAASVWFSAWGAQQGLIAPQGKTESVTSVSRVGRKGFGRDPLYRKEFLWFIRDRSAIVQSILVPLTIAGFQLFNFRGLLSHAQDEWNYLSGAAILFGTYFLWILGPRSLSSEGTALWISMTWPRGMESLLKAKAWLWSLVSTGIVGLVLCYAIFRFPTRLWAIIVVGIGWFFFSRSMAEKTVTLVSVPDSSGERPPIHWGRKAAAQLGMLTFAIGVLAQQWTIAVNGIVYSYLTAAAMWQNFRARLPYLYDPWSEEVPPAPTLMHAMIGVSLLVEGGAIVTGIFIAAGGREYAAMGMAIGYAISSVAVWIGMSIFLSGREVSARQVWTWSADRDEKSFTKGGTSWTRAAVPYVYGLLGGIALALIARVYMAVLQHIPSAEQMIRSSKQQMLESSDLRFSLAIMAIGVAPFAEEYLFRGLLFRALDREWGGWSALLGSAAFFAIYHPPLSWLPVALVGAANAFLFKKTRRLAPAVLLHMTYNALVVLNS